MDILGSGLVTLANGVLASLGAVASPLTIAAAAAAASLWQMARVEIEDADRRGTKPLVERH